MEKTVLASASCYTQMYYLNKDFEKLPTNIKTELRYICVPLAEKLHCIFSIGFYDNGNLYLEAQAENSDFNFDEIGSQLEIKKLQAGKESFFKSLKLWFLIFKTPEGEKLKQKLIKSN